MKNNGSLRLASSRLQAALATLHQVGFLAASLSFGAATIHAATYTWDTNSATAGFQAGSGTWSTSSNNWHNGTTSGQPWQQTSGTVSLHNAVLAGTDAAANTYSISLSSALAAGTLTFSNTGYQLTAASAQTLALTAAGNAVVAVAGGKTATIGSNVTVNMIAASNTGTRTDLTTGGTLEIAAGGTLTRTGQITSGFSTTGGTMGFMGNGTINVAGTLSFNVPTPVNNGGIVLATNAGNIYTLNVNGGTVSSNSAINGIALVASGSSGTLNVNSGLVSTTGTTAVTSGVNLANGAGTTGIVNLNGGTISTFQINSNYYNGSNVLTSGGNSTFNFNGGTLRAIANNANFMAGLTASNVASGGAVINSNGFNITIGQALLDGTGGGGLTKSGNGTLTLTGASTYTGNTSVNVGTLAVNGSLASNVSVASGATLSGTGSTTGSVTFNTGSAFTVNPADSFAANGVNFAGNTTLNFSSALTANTTYDVVNFGSGSLTGQGNIIKTVRGTFSTAGSILQFTAGSISTNTWNSTNGTWQVSGSTPWLNGSDNEFWAGDTVIFDNTPGANASVSLVGSLAPASTTVNSTLNYAWSGTGVVSGTGSLTKSGSGSLTLATANTYSGGTTLNAGTLVLDNASAIGGGALNIAGGALDSTTGATLSTNNAVNLTGDVSFVGTSNLNLGNGTVTLTGERTIDVAAGTLTTGRLVNTAGGLTKSGSGVLQLNPNGAISSLNGTLNIAAGTLGIGAQDLSTTGLAGNGTLQNGSATNRWVLLNTSGGNSTFGGTLQDGGAGRLGLAISGGNTVTLNGATNLTDRITVNGATTRLVLNGANTAGSASTVFLEAGGSLVLGNATALAANTLINLNGAQTAAVSYANDGGGNAYQFSGSSSSTLNVTLDRATAGENVTHNFSTPTVAGGLGGGTFAFNLTKGSNVSGTAAANFDRFNLGGGSGGNTTVNPGAGVTVTIGSVTKSNNNVSQNLVLDGVGSSHSITGAISNGVATGANSIGLIKSGSSTWTLSGNSTYTGATTISAGTLLINGDNSLATGAVTVASGATLGGSGTIGGATTVNGILSAGNSPGILSFTGNLSLGSGSTSLFEINGLARGAEYDGVNVGGALAYGGALNLVFGAPVSEGVYDLFGGSFTSQSGDFFSVSINGSVSSPVFTAGTGWSLLSGGWQYDFANATGDLTITSAIPEPSAFAAFAGLAGLGLAGLRRRRRA